jgi:hypothetical protein
VPAGALLALLAPETRERVQAIADTAASPAQPMIAGLWLITRGAAGQSLPGQDAGYRPAAPDAGRGLHTADEAAAILKCTASWLKEKARRREIPFTRISGSYWWTGAHLEEIIRLFEVPALPETPARAPVRRPAPPPSAEAPVLRARPEARRSPPARRDTEGS